MKNTLRSVGYDVQHERCGKDGTVSCFFFLRAKYYPRERSTARRHLKDNGKDERFNADKFDYIIHQVRNPLNCIPSMSAIVNRAHRQWLHDHDVCPYFPEYEKLKWCAAAWYMTNLYIETHLTQQRLRIEHALEDWPKGIRKPEEIKHQHKTSGYLKRDPLTWKQLHKLTPTYYGRIVRMAERYGYDTRKA